MVCRCDLVRVLFSLNGNNIRAINITRLDSTRTTMIRNTIVMSGHDHMRVERS